MTKMIDDDANESYDLFFKDFMISLNIILTVTQSTIQILGLLIQIPQLTLKLQIYLKLSHHHIQLLKIMLSKDLVLKLEKTNRLEVGLVHILFLIRKIDAFQES